MKKSILITGCSSGIGYDAAITLKKMDWTVFASCRTQDDCDRLSAEGFETLLLDYEQPATINGALEKVIKATGGSLHALFNNGAYAIPGAVEDVPTPALRQIFEANFFGWHDLTIQVIPIMRAQGYGRIINCSSVLGFMPMRWRGAYIATKHALEGLTGTLRIELADSPIDIILIEPGPIDTLIRKNARKGFEKWIDWKSSAHFEKYEVLINRLYAQNVKRDRFELPASAVTKKLVHALEAKNPKSHYMVTLPTYFAALVKRFLPQIIINKIQEKS